MKQLLQNNPPSPRLWRTRKITSLRQGYGWHTITILTVVVVSIVFSLFIFNKDQEGAEAADWFNEEWYFRKALEIDYTKVDEDLTDFPIAVQFNPTDNIYSNTNSDGSDIRFTDKNGNALKYEIEKWDETGTSTAWVKIPTISANASTTVYIYYGNPSASDAQTPSEVWDDGFNTIQHLNATSSDLFLDSTSNNHDGTGSGTSLLPIDGKIAGGFDFDGSADYIYAPSSNSMDVDYITVEAWIRSDSPADSIHRGIVGRDDETNRNWRLGKRNENDIQFSVWVSDAEQLVLDGTALDGELTYIVGTYDGSDVRLYKDNVEIGTPVEIVGVIDKDTVDLEIGRNELDREWDGMIDEIRVSNVARSTAWLKASYYSGLGTLYTEQTEEQGPGPTMYLSFDEGYGSTTYDSSPNNYDGTIYNAVWKDESECIKGKCLYFDGSTAYVDILMDVATITADDDIFTWSLWVKPLDLGTRGVVMSATDNDGFGDNNQMAEFNVGITSNVARWQVADNGTSRAEINVATSSEWQHWVGVKNGTSMSFYVNGILTAENTGSASDVSGESPLSLHIGRPHVSERYFHGYVDEVKIYNGARTADQIKADYNKGFAVYFGSDEGSLTDGLVGYWPMNSSSTVWDGTADEVIDASGNGNHGTAAGNASTTLGKFGNGGVFDGTGDYVDVGTSAFGIDESNEFTISVWAKFDNDLTDYKYLIQRGGFTYPFVMRIDASERVNSGVRIDGSTDILIANDSLSLNTWYHIATTYKSGERNIYINGQLKASDSPYGALDVGSYSTYIGNTPADTADGFPGKIDEVRVYNRVLSPDEVRRLYEWAPGPIAHWKFDEYSGTTVYDTSASSTYAGGNEGTFSDSNVTWTQGHFGGALDFDNIGTGVIIPYSPNLSGMGALTYEAWFKRDDDTVACTIVDQHDSGSPSNAYRFYVDTDNDLQFIVNNEAGVLGRHDVADIIYQDNWYHVAGVYDGQDIKMYVNGIESGSVFSSTGGGPVHAVSSGEAAYIGGRFSSSCDGIIDDVRIYNYARSSRQILEDMHAGNKNNPIGRWSFDEGQGTTANDYGVLADPRVGSSGNNGTLINMSTSGTSTAWTKFGKSGEALKFDGIDDYVLISDHDSLDFTNAVTLDAWINPGDLSGTQSIVSKNGSYRIQTGSAKAQFIIVGDVEGYTSIIEDVGSLEANSWHHLVGVFDNSLSSNQMKIYVNGELKKQGDLDDTIDVTTADITVGTQNTGETSPYGGYIDEIKVYNYPLTLDEIRQNYNQGAQVTLSKTKEEVANTYEGLVGWWKMDDDDVAWTTEGQIIDYSGMENHGSSTSVIGTSTAKFGRAGEFDGADSYLNAGSGASLDDLGPMTISTWAYFRTGYGEGSVNMLAAKDGLPETEGEWYFGITSGGQLRFSKDFSTTDLSVRCATTVSTDVWNHLVASWNGGSDARQDVNIYINGVRCNDYNTQTDGVGSVLSDASNIFFIGNNEYTNRTIDGMIDEVKIWNIALTPEEIMREYVDGPAPVGYWKMDDMSGTTVVDSSGSGNDLTFTNSPAWITIGKFGSAVDFSAANANLRNDSINEINSPVGSISYWLWFEDKDLSQGIFDYIEDGSNALRIQVSSGNNIQIDINDDGDLKVRVNYDLDNLGDFTNQWLHFMWTNDDTEIKLYINGIERTLSEAQYISGWWTDHLQDPISIVLGYMSAEFTGKMDEVKMYDYALTSRQVAQEYNGGEPVGYWKLDKGEGGTAYDYSGNSNDGTIYPGTAGDNTSTSTMWSNGATGKLNGSMDFDGNDDYVDIGSALLSTTDSSQPYSGFAWIKTTDTDGVVISQYTAASGVRFGIRVENGNVVYWKGGSDIAISSQDVNDGNWHHIGFIKEASQVVKLYIDGQEDGSGSDTDVFSSTNFEIGRFAAATTPYDGLIDEVKVWNYALTPEDVKKEYNGSFGVFFQ